jgi:hypothetical protein
MERQLVAALLLDSLYPEPPAKLFGTLSRWGPLLYSGRCFRFVHGKGKKLMALAVSS